jgi:3',5'-cyclic AMP phosphodiesterase CpdA
MKIIHISDLHINTFINNASIEKVSYLFKHLSGLEFDHLIITGDVTDNGADEEFEIFRDLLEEYRLLDAKRTTAIIGNHDIFGGIRNADDILNFPERCRQVDFTSRQFLFHRLLPELYENRLSGTKEIYPFVKEFNNAVLCALNSCIPYSTFKNPFASNGEIDDEQYNTLYERLLEAQDTGKDIIILVHHHCNKMKTDSETLMKSLWINIEKQTMKMRKKKRFIAMLKAFQVKLVLHGHVHVSEHYERGGVDFYNAGGTIDNTYDDMLQYNELNLQDGKIKGNIRQILYPPKKISRYRRIKAAPQMLHIA